MSLDRRLAHYSAFTGSTLKNNRHWKMYAAVTGSAIALATNASADIIYSGIQDIPVSIASATVSNAHPANTVNVAVGSHASFAIGVQQNLGHGSVRGAAYLKGGSIFGFLNSTQGLVRKLASGSRISANLAPFQNFYNPLASQTIRTSNHKGSHAGWSASKAGFAGFSFQTGNMAQKDYGWLQLVFTVGANGAANQFEVIDWGYNNTGGSILAGQETSASSTTPEPGTAALALLAAGATGVVALRRRRASRQS